MTMDKAAHEEQERKVKDAIARHGHNHAVTYHHGLMEKSVNAITAVNQDQAE